MINNKKEHFIKVKSGYVIPVYTFLSINHLNIQNMILVVEPNDSFSPFEELELAATPIGIMIASSDLRISEISQSMKKVCLLSNHVIRRYREKIGFEPRIDDLF